MWPSPDQLEAENKWGTEAAEWGEKTRYYRDNVQHNIFSFQKKKHLNFSRSRFHDVWYNKQCNYLNSVLHSYLAQGPSNKDAFHHCVCFQRSAKDLNYRVEGKRPFTEPTKATPVEQRCQVFLEEFLDCNICVTTRSLLLITMPPMIFKKSGKTLLFLSTFSVQRDTLHVRCPQVWWSRCQMSSWQGLRTSGAISQFDFLWNQSLKPQAMQLALGRVMLVSSTSYMTPPICSGSFNDSRFWTLTQCSKFPSGQLGVPWFFPGALSVAPLTWRCTLLRKLWRGWGASHQHV